MLRSTCLASTLLLALPLFALQPAQSDTQELAGGPLLEHMESLKDNLKEVAMGLQASDDAAVLEHLAEMQRLVLLAKLESPPNLEEQPKGEREAHQTHFRKDLALLLGELAAMEVEVLDGEPTKAFGRVTGSLYRMREEAHARYQLER